MYVKRLAEIDAKPFAALGGGGAPPGPDVLLGGLFRLVPGQAGGSRGALSRAQKHPCRLAPGIVLLFGDGHGPVAVALVAEELAVRVKARGPETDAPLEIVVDGDAHRSRMPEIALTVLHRGAVARAGQEAAGLVGIGVVFRERKVTERTVGHIDAVGIGVELGAGAGVLEIIFSVVLVHPGALDIRPVREHAADQRLDLFRNHALGDALRLVKGLVFGVDLLLGGREDAVVLAEALIADLKGMPLNERLRLGFRQHGLRIELHAVDRRNI